MRRVLVVAIVMLAGCATGGGEDTSGRARDASVETARVDAQIFPLEDTSSVDDTATADPDSGAADTEPDGEIDTGPTETTTLLTVDTIECRTITCPSSHPYVAGCNVVLGGASSIGCAAHVAGSTTLLFKEGQSCGDIVLRGTITCSSAPGTGLNAGNCLMNKPTKLYVASLSACPT